jgi:hypothetical protein
MSDETRIKNVGTTANQNIGQDALRAYVDKQKDL